MIYLSGQLDKTLEDHLAVHPSEYVCNVFSKTQIQMILLKNRGNSSLQLLLLGLMFWKTKEYYLQNLVFKGNYEEKAVFQDKTWKHVV